MSQTNQNQDQDNQQDKQQGQGNPPTNGQEQAPPKTPKAEGDKPKAGERTPNIPKEPRRQDKKSGKDSKGVTPPHDPNEITSADPRVGSTPGVVPKVDRPAEAVDADIQDKTVMNKDQVLAEVSTQNDPARAFRTLVAQRRVQNVHETAKFLEENGVELK